MASPELRAFGPTRINANDPAFAPPHEQAGPDMRARSKLVYRDLPLTTIQTTWSVDQVRQALWAHMVGVFDQSAQLWDSVLGDDRVTATMGSRLAGLFGKELRFRPANDSDAAKECCDAWAAHFPRIAGDMSLQEMHTYTIGVGFSPSQVVWDTTRPIWYPYVRPWHPRFTYYHWEFRKFVALSLDGSIPIVPGDGKWMLHSQWGHQGYRSWVRGALRAVAEPWMLRKFAFRDMARYSEVHGLPTRVGVVPAVSDPGERAKFESDIANLGSDAAMILPSGVDRENSYDYKLVEAVDTSWQVFPGLIDRCDMAIVLALLFQNLTTEVKGGSFAATDAHMDVRQSGIQGDNEAWRTTIYDQLARPFAYLNFGDPELAPWTEWDVQARDNYSQNAKQFQAFGTAVEVLRRGGVQFRDVEELRSFARDKFGLDGLPDFEITAPVSGGLGK